MLSRKPAVRLRAAGLAMDVDQIRNSSEVKNNCYNDWIAYQRNVSTMTSAFEHIVPEQMFSTAEDPVEAVSTVKALAIANRQGQKVYTLTEDNADQLVNITIDTLARQEIQGAISQGFEVTVHERPIELNGWVGSGYSIIDPETGAGVWKISGGISGGFMSDDTAGYLTFFGFGFGIAGALSGVIALIAISAVIAVILNADLLLDFAGSGTKCLDLAVVIIFSVFASIVSIFAGPFYVALLSYISFIAGNAAQSTASSATCQ